MRGRTKSAIIIVLIFIIAIMATQPSFFSNNLSQIASNIPTSVPSISIPSLPALPQQSIVPSNATVYVADLNINFAGTYVPSGVISAYIKGASINPVIVTYRYVSPSTLQTFQPALPVRTDKSQIVLYLVVKDNFYSTTYYSTPIITVADSYSGAINNVVFRMMLPAKANYQVVVYSSTGFNGQRSDLPLIYPLST